MVGLGFFNIHHYQLLPLPYSSPSRLSSHSQVLYFPQVCPLKPEFQHPGPVCTSRYMSQAGDYKVVAQTICIGLSSACHKPAATHSYKPLKLPSECPSLSPDWWRGFSGWGNYSLFFFLQLPPQGTGPIQISSFLFPSTQLCDDLSCSFGCPRSTSSIK